MAALCVAAVAIATAFAMPLRRGPYLGRFVHVINEGEITLHQPSLWLASSLPACARSSTITMQGTLYSILGVQPGASHAELRAAYRERAKACHPDVNPTRKAAQEFQKLTEVGVALCECC